MGRSGGGVRHIGSEAGEPRRAGERGRMGKGSRSAGVNGAWRGERERVMDLGSPTQGVAGLRGCASVPS